MHFHTYLNYESEGYRLVSRRRVRMRIASNVVSVGIALAAQLLLGMGETPLALLDSHCFFDKAPPFELEEVANLNDLGGGKRAGPNGANRTPTPGVV